MTAADRRRDTPPKFAREPYAEARRRTGLPPHPAKVAWDKKLQATRDAALNEAR